MFLGRGVINGGGQEKGEVAGLGSKDSGVVFKGGGGVRLYRRRLRWIFTEYWTIEGIGQVIRIEQTRHSCVLTDSRPEARGREHTE